MENWIKTSDSKPVTGEYVLLLLEGETMLKGKLNYNGWAAFFADGERSTGTRDVTHWMYLPALPGAEQKQNPKMSREEIAAMAMQGFIAAWGNHDAHSVEEIANDAVMAADALLLKLSKP